MRRVLTFLTAAVLALVSLGVGVFTADLPFWRRALQLPLSADGIYLPVATIGGETHARAGDPPANFVVPAIEAEALEVAAQRARGAGSRALLVMRDGRIQLERYFAADDVDSLLPAGLMAGPLAAMAAGIALGDGRIGSLDVPVAQYLPEWDDEARGRITLRQLLEQTSGLETGGNLHRLLRRSPWEDLARLPQFATSKGVRMLLGNDFSSTALRFQLEHEPGGFYNRSPANAQLVAVIVERATGTPYERFIDERLWRAVGAGRAELPLDRRVGMPAAHCCWRAAARDMLRIVGLLATDGVYGERRVLPVGWVAEMARASRVNADTGLQVTRFRVDDMEGLSASDSNGSAFWVIPDRRIVILDIANPGATSPPELPESLLRALAP